MKNYILTAALIFTFCSCSTPKDANYKWVIVPGNKHIRDVRAQVRARNLEKKKLSTITFKN